MRTIFFYLARNSVEGREVEMDVYIYIYPLIMRGESTFVF